MKRNSGLLSILIVALSMGTAWAIRGQFGHEHGAAWAGAIGSLSTLLVMKRTDWITKGLYVTLAGALGWGLGGMMSYGLLVGYGRADDFANVLYGLGMLFFVGGLYGFMGGGFFGVALSDTKRTVVHWVNLILEMTVGGIIFYFFLVEQFGWHVNPPRSEIWAVCLGISVALAWNMIRHKNYAALRVAIFTCLGAGFGFAFGNFLQVLGQVSEIHFNFWNVMEYSLGFFGGIGLAYGTFTSTWEQQVDDGGVKSKQLFSLVMLVAIIPFIMWQQNFEWERIQKTFVNILSTDNSTFYLCVQWGSLFLILFMAIYWISRFKNNLEISYSKLYHFFIGHWLLYIALSFIITGAFVSIYRPEQYLYLVNYVIVLILINRVSPSFTAQSLQPASYIKGVLSILVVIMLLSYILIHTHGEFKGSHKRFGEVPTLVDTVGK